MAKRVAGAYSADFFNVMISNDDAKVYKLKESCIVFLH